MAYYIDATAGSDSGDGLTEATAWQTFTNVKASNFSAGIVCRLKRGESWTELLTVPSSGVDGDRITFDAYGIGADPIIDGEGTRDCIWILGKTYITIKNIETRNGAARNILLHNGASYITVGGCTFTDYQRGIMHNDTNGPMSRGVIIRDCTFQNGQLHGIAPQAYCDGWLIENNVLTDSGQAAGNGSAVKIGLVNTGNHIIQGNICTGGGPSACALWTDTTNTPSVFRYNLVQGFNGTGNFACGIFLEKGVGHQAYYNKVTGCSRGILLYGVTGNAIEDCLVYNNTLYGNGDNIELRGDGNAGAINNNSVRNNICLEATTRELKATLGGENDGVMGSNNVYTHNCLGPESSGFIEWGSGVAVDTYAAWETAYGSDTYSAEGDPLLTNMTALDFRPRWNSVCIDAGIYTGLTEDCVGIPVPQRTAPDIGAYERVNDSMSQSGSSGRQPSTSKFRPLSKMVLAKAKSVL